MAKHSKQEEPRIIQLRDYQDPQAAAPQEEGPEAQAQIEYGDAPPKKGVAAVPKAVYQVAIILLVLIIGLAVWMNRTNLTPENIGTWLKHQVTGSQIGDGYPAQITGSTVAEANFLAYGGSVVTLSDTALTIRNSTGHEELALRHSLSQPVLQGAEGRFLLYNCGSTGYMALAGTEVMVSGVSQRDILCGAIAQNGRFALATAGGNGASELNVYQKDGTLQASYQLAKDYITAVAMNYDGAYAAVCTVRSEKGLLISKVIVYDFTSEDPVAEYELENDLLLSAYWGENGMIYAVGDSALLSASSSDYAFTQFPYQGRKLTAFHLAAGRAFLSISAYEHAGPSTLLVYAPGQEQPLKIEQDKRIESISVYGGTVGLLIGSDALFYDYSSGSELGRADAGGDARALALSSESTAYVLGVSEVRTVKADG